LPLYHFDWYRLENINALRAIGFDEYVFGNGATVIEWADKFPSALPPATSWIKFELMTSDVRRIDSPPFE